MKGKIAGFLLFLSSFPLLLTIFILTLFSSDETKEKALGILQKQKDFLKSLSVNE